MMLIPETQQLLATMCFGFVMIWIPLVAAMGLTRLLAFFFGWRIHGRD